MLLGTVDSDNDSSSSVEIIIGGAIGGIVVFIVVVIFIIAICCFKPCKSKGNVTYVTLYVCVCMQQFIVHDHIPYN